MHTDTLVTKQIIIDYNHTLTRIAVKNNGQLTHFYMDSPLDQSAQDRIVVGQVDKVVKNLQGAFVDFGEEKNGLLHFKQVPPAYQNRMQQGARIPVQVKKENTGQKGHKLTGYLTIQGYNLVCMVFEPVICFSKKIKEPSKKQIIKEMLEKVTCGEVGFLVRTKAKDIPVHLLQKEAIYLVNEAKKLLQTKDFVCKGTLLKQDEPLAMQVILENLKQEERLEVISNNEEILQSIKDKIAYFIDDTFTIDFKAVPKKDNVFRDYDCEKYFDASLKRKVWLKNGGNIVIDYTEAMTVVDVNSAKAVLTKNQSKAVLELNTLAVKETLLQIMQRNIAGIIMIDLVEMKDVAHKEEVYNIAKTFIEKYDRERTKVYPLTELGLLQVARTKKYVSLPEILMGTCRACKGMKLVPSTVYKMYEIERNIKHMSEHTLQDKIYLYCHGYMKQMLLENEYDKIFEKSYGIKVILQEDKKFDEKSYEFKYHPI